MGLSGVNWNGRRPDSINVDAFPYELEAPRLVGAGSLGMGLLGVFLFTLLAWKRWTTGGPKDWVVVMFLLALLLLSIPGLVTGAWRLFRPDLLRLSNAGLEFHSLWRRSYWRWSQVRGFHLNPGRQPRIVFRPANPAGADWGGDMTLSTRWPISADRLVKILNHASVRLGANAEVAGALLLLRRPGDRRLALGM